MPEVLEVEARLKDFISQNLDTINKNITLFAANAQQSSKKTAQGFDGVSSSITSLATRYLTLSYAGFKLIGISSDIIKQAAEQESADKRLIGALKEKGFYTEEVFESYKKFASAMQDQSRFTDEEIEAAQRLGTNYGLFGDTLNRVVKTSVELAVAKDLDLASAMDMVAKTISTDMPMLRQFRIEVEGNANSTERLESVLSQLNERVGGSARADLETFTGAWGQFKKTIGEVEESIGEKFLPKLTKLAEIGTKFLKKGYGEQIGKGKKMVLMPDGTLMPEDQIITFPELTVVKPPVVLSSEEKKAAEESFRELEKQERKFNSESDVTRKKYLEFKNKGIIKNEQDLREHLKEKRNSDIKEQVETLQKQIDIEDKILQERRQLYTNFASSLGSAMVSGIGKGAEGFKESLKAVLTTGLNFVEQYALIAIAAAIAKGTLTFGASLFEIFGITAALGAAKAGVSSFARGTSFYGGGMAMVGEQGRELVNLPYGSRVYNHTETERIINNNNNNVTQPVVLIVNNSKNLKKNLLSATRDRSINWDRVLQGVKI